MNSKNSNSTYGMKSPWYKSKTLAICLFLISVFNWMFVYIHVSGMMKIKPTMLVLKKDGCDLMRQKGIAVAVQHPLDSCNVTLPFKQNLIGSGGRAYIGDRQDMMSVSQIVVVAEAVIQSWTPEQKYMMTWLGSCTFFIFVMATWVFFLFMKNDWSR